MKKFRIATVVGARPQFIKASVISRTIRKKFSSRIQEIIVHTGQHYDPEMSDVFFRELEIPHPDFHLEVGSGSHAEQTGKMLMSIEDILLKTKPHLVLVYGDTNSTLAGALAAAKLHVPVTHVEAGLRSFNMTMPEEINRIAADKVSTLLFCPTDTAIKNLLREGIRFNKNKIPSADNPKIIKTGDVMYDSVLYFPTKKKNKILPLGEKRRGAKKYILATIHRPANTDSTEKLSSILKTFQKISSRYDVILPLHPRTKKLMHQNLPKNFIDKIDKNNALHIIPPASYLEMVSLLKNSSMVMTDSGGVQKEAFFFRRPCITLRSETEWTELVKNGNNIVTDTNEKKILSAIRHFENNSRLNFPAFYGNGNAGEEIVKEILKFLHVTKKSHD